MNLNTLLPGWKVPDLADESHIRKYSTIGDILAYRRCRKQYGFFSVRGFSSATATQTYFGTLVHDVLDRVNRDYILKPALPDTARVSELVEQAHDRLIRSGIRPYNAKQQKERATKLIDRFVKLIGPNFFQYVQETEYRLERALKTPSGQDYILEGIVDVVSGAVSHALGLPYSTEPDDVEIWDYKSGSIPEKGSLIMQDYEYQMRVYAELYCQQKGEYPARSVLVFVGELGDDKRWNLAAGNPSMFPHLIYPTHPNPKHINAAMSSFHKTVEDIEAERALPYAQQWDVPCHTVDEQTCEVCELRYSCDKFPNGATLRAEAL